MPAAAWNVPNLLSLSRLPLTAALCALVALDLWLPALLVFAVAGLTDWLDGWWARKFNQYTPLGRALDPLTDKVLTCGAFIFLVRVPDAGVEAWMVTVVVVRELLITGLRGMVEAGGKAFGADWFGKLKTVLQIAALVGVLLTKALRANGWLEPAWPALGWLSVGLLYAMLVATVGSALQYISKAVKMLAPPTP